MKFPAYSEAVVLGGSMTGMMAASVLAKHFDRVTLIERDEYPDSPSPRTGVPQARHLHALLTCGYRILKQLFPGIADDWRAAGAEVLDTGRDIAWRTPAGWGIRFDSGLEMLAASRALIDFVVRRRLAALPNVSVLQGVSALSLVTDASRRRVSGVRVVTTGDEIRTLASDLTVDATGRMSRAPDWLRQLGYDPPEETVVDARLGYASRFYHRRPEQERNWRAVFIQAAPPEQPRAGIAFPVEGDRWMVTLCGGGGDFAPTDEQSFTAFARSLPSREIYDLICAAEPAGPITGYRRTENRWRHYERLRRRPEGLVVIGDAACAFNPVYGQGITVAALQVAALDKHLAKGGRLAHGILEKELAEIIATPWALATGEDLRYPGAGKRPALANRLLQRYVHGVMATSTRDPDVRRALLDVFTMVEPPARLMQGAVLSRVLQNALGSRDHSTEDNARRPYVSPGAFPGALTPTEPRP